MNLKKIVLIVIFMTGAMGSTSLLASTELSEDEAADFAEFADPDPWYRINRITHRFNAFLDKNLIRPIAIGYRAVVPQMARNGVSNVFHNLADVNNVVNNLLQGKPGSAGSDLGRLLINTTIGLGGLFDPASQMGLVEHQEDFGQTFGRWGISTGPYVVLPGLGPSNVRDGVSRLLDGVTDPVRYLYPVTHRNGVYAMRLLQQRTDLLTAESVVFGDEYIFYRDAFLQRRDYLVNDGKVSDPFADDF